MADFGRTKTSVTRGQSVQKEPDLAIENARYHEVWTNGNNQSGIFYTVQKKLYWISSDSRENSK